GRTPPCPHAIFGAKSGVMVEGFISNPRGPEELAEFQRREQEREERTRWCGVVSGALVLQHAVGQALRGRGVDSDVEGEAVALVLHRVAGTTDLAGGEERLLLGEF